MSKSQAEEQWIAFEVMLHPCMADAVANFFHEHRAGGVVLEDTDPERSRVTAYVPRDDGRKVSRELREYLAQLHEVFPDVPDPAFTESPLEPENWATAWQSNFRPLPIGHNLLVTPPWIDPEPRGRVVIVIEPAEAFGTGTHETTQGCLELLEEAIRDFNETGQRFTVLDVGCGSGILAIAAAKLGAQEVRAVDNDPVAVEAARKNVSLNKAGEKVRLECLCAQNLNEPADIVAANLDPLALKENRPQLVKLFTRYLIISGVPVEQWKDIKAEFLAAHIVLKKEIVGPEWGSGLFGK